jgi:hypothetical protein
MAPPEAPFQLFISYRRQDSSGHTGRLYDSLSAHLGEEKVFMDVDNLEGGDHFEEVIRRTVSSCTVLLAVIGQDWLTVEDEKGRRRLENPLDFVRLEISEALKRGILVIPVLVQGMKIPRAEDLPDDLAGLSRRQAVELSDSRWSYDVGRLLKRLDKERVKIEKAKAPEVGIAVRKPTGELLARTELPRMLVIVSIGGVVFFLLLFLVLKTLPKAGDGAGEPVRTIVPPETPVASDTASNDEEYPAVGALRMDGQLQCTGTVIGPETVLTSAQCLFLVDSARTRMTFVLGSDVSAPTRVFAVSGLLVHEQFNPETFANNLGIVHLQTPVNMQQSISIAYGLRLDDGPVSVSFIGYGAQQSPGTKRVASLLISSADDKKYYYSTNSGAPCTGDSGGPAFADGKVYGVLSSGNCQGSGTLTRTDAYTDWIQENFL